MGTQETVKDRAVEWRQAKLQFLRCAQKLPFSNEEAKHTSFTRSMGEKEDHEGENSSETPPESLQCSRKTSKCGERLT